MPAPLNSVQRFLPSPVETPGKVLLPPDTPRLDGEGGFGKLFGEFLNAVNELHNEVGEAQQALLAGEPIELHQVMIKAEEAGIATDLLLQIRNRLVDGINELMRMPM